MLRLELFDAMRGFDESFSRSLLSLVWCLLWLFVFTFSVFNISLSALWSVAEHFLDFFVFSLLFGSPTVTSVTTAPRALTHRVQVVVFAINLSLTVVHHILHHLELAPVLVLLAQSLHVCD